MRLWLGRILLAIGGLYAFLVTIDFLRFIERLFFADNLYDFATPLIGMAQFLFAIPFFLVVFAIFSRHIKLVHILWAIALAGLVESHAFFENDLHGFFVIHGLYPHMLYPPAEQGQGVPNPQFAKLFVFFAASITLALLLIFIKKFRSLDRIIILLISFISLLTAFMFHVFLVHGALLDMRDRRLAEIEYISQNIEDNEIFLETCEARNLFCMAQPPDQPISHPSATIEAAIREVNNYAIENNINDMTYSWHSAFSLSDPNLRSYIITYRLKDNEMRAVIDQFSYARDVDLHQALFSIGLIFSHIIWLNLGLWLIFLHRYKFRKWFRGLLVT